MDPLKGRWSIYNLSFDNKTYLVPYKISKHYKIDSIAVELHSSITISISNVVDDGKYDHVDLERKKTDLKDENTSILALPKFLFDNIADLDATDLHFIPFNELENTGVEKEYSLPPSDRNRPYIMVEKFVEGYKLTTGKIGALEMIVIDFHPEWHRTQDRTPTPTTFLAI